MTLRILHIIFVCRPDHLVLTNVLCFIVSTMAFSSPHTLRIREGTPTGTVLIPDLPTYLGSSTQDTKHHEPSETNENSLLAIGNTAMPGVDWFVIDQVRKRLVVKTPPDRDALCPSEWKLPETALTVDRGGIEFPDYAISTNSKQGSPGDINECVLKLSVVHGSATNPSFDIISIVLEDTNDHAPTFPIAQEANGDVLPIVIQVQENYGSSNALNPVRTDKSISPTKISLPVAKDPDQGVNGIRGYRLEGQDAYHFRLEVGLPSEEQDSNNYAVSQSKASLYRHIKSSQLWLVPVDTRSTGLVSATSGELDRELRAEYNLVLVAFDGGSPQRSARLPIRLVVEDVNDHAPVFNQPWYSGQISENDPPGHVIFEFSAHDGDSKEENGIINFRIPGEVEHNAPSGTTSTRTDHSGKHLAGLSDSQLAAANFFAVEQRFEGSVDTKNFRTSLRDNNTYGRLIIRHLPRDQLRNAARQAILAAQRSRSLLGPKGLPSELYQTYDFKPSNSPRVGLRLEFVIEASDHGKPSPLTARVPAYVNILDVNDHAPQIFVSYLQHAAVINSDNPFDNIKKPTWGRIKENLARAMVAQITVVDEDAEPSEMDILCTSSDSRFALEDISAGRESIGDISNMWLLTSLSSKSITDHVGISKSSDTRARRQIIPTQMYKLMLTSPLDREASVSQPSRVEFAVTCTDNVGGRLPGGSLTSQIPVRILIEDTNDNSPVFEQLHYTFHVPENHPSLSSRSSDVSVKPESYYIGQIKAVDVDEGWFASIEYQLVSNPLSSLDLNTNTGQLYVIRPFDRETTNEVVFQVIAIDCKPTFDNGTASLTTEKRLSGTAEVRLVIDDLNDSPPNFEESNYQFEVEEGVDLARVGQVSAKDADEDESARLFYRLAVGPVSRLTDSPMFGRSFVQKSPTSTSYQALDEALEINTHFQIDPSNGVIRLKGRLDRERRSHYEFLVLAVDNPRSTPFKLEGKYGGAHGELTQFTATATVLVTVLDHNDNPPLIISPRNHAEFTLGPDQLIAGNTVFTIQATDPDLGENGTIGYQLLKVETDLGSVRVADFSMSTIHENISTPAPAEVNSYDATEYNPFAVDATEGICYLRENLPSLDTVGPRAYLLRIRAYDMGRPLSLNTSLIVRVIRQPLGAIVSSAISELHVERREQSIGGKSETHFLAEPTTGLDVQLSSWNGPSHSRISDRTMVIILSTVFVLLLLTTIVLLLLIRYRRLFLRNIALANSRSNDSPLNKANMGYTAGKPFITSHYVNGTTGLFSEVMTAPWVNNPSSTLDSPNSINYPTMCSMTVNPTINANRFCARSPGGCWSPMGPAVCVSSGINYPFEVMNHHRVAHSPLKLSNGSPGYSMGIRSRSYGQNQGSGCTVQPSDRSLEMGPPLLFENYAACEDQRDFRTLTVDNRVKHLHANNVTGTLEQNQNKVRAHHPGFLVPNAWAKLTPAPSTPPTRGVQCQLRRAAVSLETLNTNQENSCADNYNKLMQFTPTTDSLVLLQQSCSPCMSTSVCAGHDEYQALLMRDCQPHIFESQPIARNKQVSGPRWPDCPLSESVCFSDSSPNNNGLKRNSHSVGAYVQMPTPAASSLSTTTTENHVLPMTTNTFAEQGKPLVPKGNAQSSKGIKLRWNLKARHKPSIAPKPSQNRRTRQPFVTFEKGDDADETDSTSAKFVKSEIRCGHWESTVTRNRKLDRSYDAKSVSQPTTPVKTATVQVQGSFV